MRVAIIEPWFGESHATHFSGVAKHTVHDASLTTLPARKWRWRMRTGAYHLSKPLTHLEGRQDVLLVSDYVNLPVLKCFAPHLAGVPTAVYFLENQLTYPKGTRHTADFEFMAINVLTCLAAEQSVFCSKRQQDDMMAAIPTFLKHDAEADPDDIVRRIAAKSRIIPIGVDLERFDRARKSRTDRTGRPLRIVWPHRFEHDKNPDDFYEVVKTLDDEGLPFELSVIGLSYRDLPQSLQEMRERLSHRIVDWGFLKGDAYPNALAASDLVLSTAWQETQGLAVIEAIRAGCDPLLPDRLSYPEVLGPVLSEKHLYRCKGDLRRRLRWMMRHPERVRATSNHWRAMERFGWSVVGPQFDQLFEDLTG